MGHVLQTLTSIFVLYVPWIKKPLNLLIIYSVNGKQRLTIKLEHKNVKNTKYQ